MNTLLQIGQTIKHLRRITRMSQEQLANNSNIDRRYLSDVENGKRNLSILLLEKIAICFEMSVLDLLRLSQHYSNGFDSLEALKDQLCDQGYENSVVLESPSYIEAVVGISSDGKVIYDYNLMVLSLLNSSDEISHDEAIEFIEYNTVRALSYMGDNAPIILYPLI